MTRLRASNGFLNMPGDMVAVRMGVSWVSLVGDVDDYGRVGQRDEL